MGNLGDKCYEESKVLGEIGDSSLIEWLRKIKISLIRGNF